MLIIRLKHLVQRFLGKFLNVPIIFESEIKGFSLQRSQRMNFNASSKVKYGSPYSFRNVEIGDFTYVAANSTISNTKIGKFCSIGPNFFCGAGIHPVNGISTSPTFYSTTGQNGTILATENKIIEEKEILIGNDVFIGVNVTILDDIKIGNGAIIGAGSIVTKDIPAYAVAVGVPAKVVKYRFEDDVIEKLQALQWWNFAEEQLKDVEKYFFDVQGFLKKNNLSPSLT